MADAQHGDGSHRHPEAYEDDRRVAGPGTGAPGEDVSDLRQRLAELDRERAMLAARLAELEAAPTQRARDEPETVGGAAADVTRTSSPAAKIALFRELFRGRPDVFPARWENPRTGKAGYAPVCRNEWVPGLCGKPRVRCGACPNQAFVAVTDKVIRDHMLGRRETDGTPFTAGVYPMLADDTCRFVAIDFDKGAWMRDVAALRETARRLSVPVAVERSRSGNGAHVWIFFSEPVPASRARGLASLLVSATQERRPDIGFGSYDRFFPSQDTLPTGGFGNLIALPLQSGPRAADNSVFVDASFRSYQDQWAHLSNLQRLSRDEVEQFVASRPDDGDVPGVRAPARDPDDPEPWAAPPLGRTEEPPITEPVPEEVELVLGNQIYINRTALPPALVARLARLAAFQNPAFHAAQAMRLSTHGKPRVIACGELFADHLALPRGCLEEARALLGRHGVTVRVRDERTRGVGLNVGFNGQLTAEQEAAVAALRRFDTGVLAATTAFGKTVVAASLIAERQTNTLVLVHRRHLLQQWVERLGSFLGLGPEAIGIIGGGKRRPTGRLDVAVIQSLNRKGVVDDLVATYGQIVVDECHHVSAVRFEAVAQAAKARYVLGLSATVTRKDGHHPIVLMQCGPVRHRVDARRQARGRPFGHRVVSRRTDFVYSRGDGAAEPRITDLYAAIAADAARNALIVGDVRAAVRAGRVPVVMTERRQHADRLAALLAPHVPCVVRLRAGLPAAEVRAARRALADEDAAVGRVLVATGRYLGEGFDNARLDTLFLAMPISWRGTLAQYAGRLHRLHAAKREVVIYDYVDASEPVFARMAERRDAGYRGLGYTIASETPLGL